MWIRNYKPTMYDFVGVVQSIFELDNLSTLGAQDDTEVVRPETDQQTPYHRKFYDACADDFLPIYRDFVHEVSTLFMGTRHVLYQMVPTFRVQLPYNKAVGAWHRDKDYNHQDGELTFWVPLTPAWDTNTVWVESSPEVGDYQPIALFPGQYLVFDSVNLAHGNQINITGYSRVSFDFRCIRKADFKDEGLKSVAAGRRMTIGDYWAELYREGSTCP